ncbi:beta-L-arabinofuranosidase domain-containing protein [Pedobacter sp. GR22-6]|uniref:beta-L-arabinofuranosidase domain-containing protein n=1 Tax=Pedobacter sp. GR22-6 TaxID=3127957 RepID=UPI00307EA43E
MNYMMMKPSDFFLLLGFTSLLAACAVKKTETKEQWQLAPIAHTRISDRFWSPRFELWRTTTSNDVLDKFEGKHLASDKEREESNAFANFDDVASGQKGTGRHAGFPWFDGLVYESIRGIGDLIGQYPDPALQARLDAYIDRIAAAQAADPSGYLNTYTYLVEPAHRWGDNGGFLRYQHDVYNAGMLIEAGVHYYRATAKTKLLEVATRYANYMSELMGPAPKRNIVPAHAGPEEAMMKLYQLYREQPDLKKKIAVPVHEQDYYALTKFWIENRGRHTGLPLWQTWGNDKSEKWIKAQKFRESGNGPDIRPSWGDYAQDSISVFQQKTIEGHAVRATLLATGMVAVALDNHDPQYIQTATRLWDNMAGRRMFVTGGVGAIHNDEKFGPDYFLPTDAYLETCAAVGAGFFSQRMNELTAEGKYMDEFERVLYNNILTGVSLSGKQYTYQNPLNAHDHARWEWHSCPCCPPMFLKMVSAMPDYIFAAAKDQVYLNLFIGSKAEILLNGKQKLRISQETNYPWEGRVTLQLEPENSNAFTLNLRIPGWALAKENPYELYRSNLNPAISLTVNGQPEKLVLRNGYAMLSRKWNKGDKVELQLPMQPRFVSANAEVKDLKGKVAIASGPVIYSLEAADNGNVAQLNIDTTAAMTLSYRPDLLNGVNVIQGKTGSGKSFTAIPYYAVGNREGKGYQVWTDVAQPSVININVGQVENRLSALLYGSNIEDVNHEIYGGFYDQRIFGESFEEPATGVNFQQWRRYSGYWTANNDVVSIIPGRNTHSAVRMNGIHQIGVEPDQSAKLIYEGTELTDGIVEADIRFTGKGESGAILLRVDNAGVGNDVFDAYEVGLSRNGRRLIMGKHFQNFELLKEAAINVDATSWNRLKVELKGTEIMVSLNGKPILSYKDERNPLLKGKIGLRTWRSDLEFRKLSISRNGGTESLKLSNSDTEEISYNWDIIRSAKATADFRLDSANAYNGKNTQLICFKGGNGRVGIANRGLNRWGIALRKGQVFQGRFYLKGHQLSGPVSIALESADGSKTYAVQQIKGIGMSWKKFPFSLKASQADKNAKLAIYLSSKGKLWVDQVVLMGSGDDQFKGLPIRADIGKMLVAQGLTFLRYAGTMVNSPEYKFKNMIGDPDRRPPYRGHWNHYTTNGFGIEEFLQFCEATGITPSFAVNIYETPEDMADMVEYLNGDVNTTWGAKRASNGHPKPYGVRYIEIGNEEVIFNGDSKKAYEEYVARFKLLQQAMKAKDSNLKFIHAAWWRPESPNMEYVFRELNGKADYWDLHVGGDDPSAGTETEKQLLGMLKRFKQWDPASAMKVAVFEENGSKHGMQRALGHATNLNAIRRHNESVLTSSPANALQPYLQNDNDWDQGQIFFSPDQVWGMPPFYAQQMQAVQHQPLRVKTSITGGLDVTASRSEDGKTLILHVVNTASISYPTKLQFEEFENRKDLVEVASLSGELNDRNSPDKPEKCKTQNTTIHLPVTNPVYEFPAYSYTILKFAR